MAATGGKKRRRRRKQSPPGATAPDPVKLEQEVKEGVLDPAQDVLEDEPETLNEDDILTLEDVASFEFQSKSDITIPDSVTEGMLDDIWDAVRSRNDLSHVSCRHPRQRNGPRIG